MNNVETVMVFFIYDRDFSDEIIYQDVMSVNILNTMNELYVGQHYRIRRKIFCPTGSNLLPSPHFKVYVTD